MYQNSKNTVTLTNPTSSLYLPIGAMAAGGQPTWLEKSHPPTPMNREHSVPTVQACTARLAHAHVPPTVTIPTLCAPPVTVPVIVDRLVETLTGSALARLARPSCLGSQVRDD